MVGEPGKYYLGHLLTKYGKGCVIVEGIKDTITNAKLEDTLTVTDTDRTAIITAPYNGAIR